MQKRIFLKSVLLAAAASSAILLSACGSKDAGTVKVGVTAGPHAAIVNAASKVAEKNGLKVQVVEFTDYISPDTALADGSLDIAVYQHEPFLQNFNKQHKTALVKAADAVVQPMGLYSNKTRSLESLPEGAKVSIPNDPSNGGRALILLQKAGLITLKDGLQGHATPADIASNPKNLRISELEAAQLPRSLEDVDTAVIPMNYVISAGLSPEKQGYFFESQDAPFALMIIATRENNKSDPKVQKFIKCYQSPEVAEFIGKTFAGAVRPAWK